MTSSATFLFNYEDFLQEAKPLIALADEGNHDAVIERAREIAHSILPGKWFMEDYGAYYLEDFIQPTPVNPVWRPGPDVTGFAFLVILSQYLEKTPYKYPSIIGRWLPHLGWSERDCDLVSLGMPTTTLMKPELVDDPLNKPPISKDRLDPKNYWHYVKPERSFANGWGWWNKDQVSMLHRKLADSRTAYEQLDIGLIETSSFLARMATMRPWRETYLLWYEDISNNYEIALKNNIGLLYVFAE